MCIYIYVIHIHCIYTHIFFYVYMSIPIYTFRGKNVYVMLNFHISMLYIDLRVDLFTCCVVTYYDCVCAC